MLQRSIYISIFFVLNFAIHAQDVYVDASFSGTSDGSMSAPWKTIQDGIDNASSGNLIFIANGTYTPSLTINVNKPVTLEGESEGGVQISSGATTYGISIQESNITISKLTLTGSGTFGIHVQPGSTDLVFSDLTVDQSGRSNIALNNNLGVQLLNITATNSADGLGVSINNCQNLQITNLTTSGNAFSGGFSAGIGIFSNGLFSPPGPTFSDNIQLSNLNCAEPIDFYVQDYNGENTGSITFPPTYTYKMVQESGTPGEFSEYYCTSKAEAYAFADAFIMANVNFAEVLYVVEISTGYYYVDGQSGMKIQPAINFGSQGQVILVEDGTYEEALVVDKTIDLSGVSMDQDMVILEGMNLSSGVSGIAIQNGVENVRLAYMTVQNFTGTNSNHAGIAALQSNHGLIAEHLTVAFNEGGRGGLYANGPVDNVVFDHITAHGHMNPGFQRGIVIWNNLKTNITITNCEVYDNACCGIELQDGSASGVEIRNNLVYDNADNGIGVIGLTSGAGPNIIADNTVQDCGRFGIEIKNPDGTGADSGDGSIVIENNMVELTLGYMLGSEVRDLAGIAVFRRAPVFPENPDIPQGVIVRNNEVNGYRQPSLSEGFGIVVEGYDHVVEGNSLSDNDIGFQVQAGHTPYTGEGGSADQGDQNNLADEYFGRGNSPITCGITDGGQTYGTGLTANGVDFRAVGFQDYAIQNGAMVINESKGSKVFCSIQQAIEDPETGAGDTIRVNTTEHIEIGKVVIDKSLTIAGLGKTATVVKSNYATASAGHGNDLSAWFLTEPGTFVRFQDFTLDGNGMDTYTGIRFQDGGSVERVGLHDIKHSASPYLGIAIQIQDGNVDISDCTFTEIGRIGAHFRAGVIEGATISGSFVNNTYTGKADGDWLDYACDISGATEVLVDSNLVTQNTGTALSDGSTSAGFLVTSFFPGGVPNDVILTNNLITNNTTGIAVGFDANDLSNVVANFNNIYDNDFGITSTAPQVDARMNWWGDASGPSGVGAGSGDEVSTFVQFCPWLTAEYDGDAYMSNAVTKNLQSEEYFCSIQEAIEDDNTTAGDEISILTTEYIIPSQLQIGKSIMLTGMGKTATTLRPGFDTGANGDARALILVNSGVELHLSDLTIDGSGHLVFQAIRHKGSGTIDSVRFTEIKYNESGPTYNGMAVAAFGDGAVDVTNCMFDEIGRIGILYFGTGVANSIYRHNMYVGKGVGDWLDYGVELGAGAVVTIDSSEISNCQGVASNDGSTSAAILVTTFFDTGTNGTVMHNDLLNNTAGIAVGFDNTDESLVTANYNNFVGNGHGVTSTAPEVNAELNWWGDASGPSGEGPGSGDAVSQFVDFCPWLDAENDGSPASVNLVVTTTANEGCGSLREAVAYASAGDTITFAGSLANQSILIEAPSIMIDKEVFIIGDPSLNLSIANANTTNTDLLIDIKEKTVFSGLIFEGLGNGQLIMKLDLNGDLEFYDSEISEKVEIQKL